jgi:hypothetical protein
MNRGAAPALGRREGRFPSSEKSLSAAEAAAAPRCNSRCARRVIRAALHLGGEWGLVASAVFKTVVPARKRRRVGSIPTRLRQVRSAEGGAQEGRERPIAFALCPPRSALRAPPRRVRQKPHLLCAARVCRVHRRHGRIELQVVLGVDEHDSLCRRAGEHLFRDGVAQFLRARHLLRVEIQPVFLHRDHELVLFVGRRWGGELQFRRDFDVEAHLQDRCRDHEDDQQHQHDVDERGDVDLRLGSGAAAAHGHI